MAKEFNPNEYKISKKESVYRGVHSDIDAVTVSVGNREVPLLRKKHKGYSIEFMDGADAHSALKERGYPVFPTWRYDEEEGMDYITDLRRGGTHKVIDFCGHPDSKKVFVSNLNELKSEAEILASKLADDGVIINEPNIFFDVEISTGIAKIILGDLREMGREMDDDKVYTRDQIFTHDKSIIDEHMNRLEEIIAEKVK